MALRTTQEIVARMRETTASQILSFVDSEKAAKISERLTLPEKIIPKPQRQCTKS